MATIRAFTTIEQSRKLVEILPLESADMRYGHIAPYEFSDRMYDGGYDKVPYPKDFLKLCADFCEEDIYDGSLHCWSLAALCNILPNTEHISTTLSRGGWKIEPVEYIDKWFCEYEDEVDEDIPCKGFTVSADNPVDACVAMVEKLHKLNLL